MRVLALALLAACQVPDPEGSSVPTVIEPADSAAIRARPAAEPGLSLDDGMPTLLSGTSTLSLHTAAWGREGATLLPSGAKDLGDRVEVDHGDVLEWWEERGQGWEQGWTLLRRPEGQGPLTITIETDGIVSLDGADLLLSTEGVAWRARGLRAWDEDGAAVPAWYEIEDGGFAVRVDDEGARWPITVDPIWTVAWQELSPALPVLGGFGSALGAGDVNADGFDDLVIGAPDGGSAGEGQVDLYLGTVAGLPATASQGYVATGAPSFGAVLHMAGDINGDSYDDILVSAPYAGGGTAFFVPGGALGPDLSGVVVLAGSGGASRFGSSLSAGDLNGDGMDDVIVGEELAPPQGKVWIFAGTAAGPSLTTSRTFSGPQAGLRYGASVSSGGDTTADGFDDFAVGAPPVLPTGTGRSYVYLGASGFFASSSTTAANTYIGTANYGNGSAVSLEGSVNGDAYADLFIGAPTGTANGYGRVYSYRSNGSALPNGNSGTFDCPQSVACGYGAALAFVPDTDGDGLADVLMGGPNAALAALYEGAISTASNPLVSASRQTVEGSGDLFGAALAGGDWNGDGHADIAVGAPGASSGVGRVVLFTGGPDADGDGYLATGGMPEVDCNDADPLVNPGATEVCDALDTDEDCDGTAENPASGLPQWFYDEDLDGYGGPVTADACDAPPGYIATGGDCNDVAAEVNPAATETCDADDTDEDCDGEAEESGATGESTFYADQDADTWGDINTPTLACDAPLATASQAGDCDDANPSVRPDAVELCDALDVDEDCDNEAEESGAVGELTFYEDDDGDLWGDGNAPLLACDRPAGSALLAGDCNDADALVRPDALELCDSLDIDEDCDGSAEEGGAIGESTFFGDGDGDGWGLSSVSLVGCDAPPGMVSQGGDCDDGSPVIHPGAAEFCDPADTDEDCDGNAEETDATGQSTFFADADGDGWGDSSMGASACDPPPGHVSQGGDCDDGQASAHPGATEVCDPLDLDEDCDGSAEESGAGAESSWYLDADGDGIGAGTALLACGAPPGRVASSTDCDDTNAAIFPDAAEVCDATNVDDDCDGLGDENPATGTTTFWLDADGDGEGNAAAPIVACDQPPGSSTGSTDCDDNAPGVSTAAQESCDAADVDEDCDGLADDADPTVTGRAMSYTDGDGDGYGVTSSLVISCDVAPGAVLVAGDCDDSEASDHPGASEEVGNEDDENCDGAERCFRDADGDGYRGLLLETVTSADLDCTDAGEAAVGLPGGDCEDEDPAFHPGATEACDDPTDWNCDGSVEYADGDSDGSAACLDCDDQDADAQPGATEEVGDGVDQDCDGGEVCLVDADDDGYVDGAGATVESPDPFCTGTGEALASAPEGDCDDDDAERHPGAAEICDEIDQNCNGEVDEGLATEEWFADADGDGFGDDATAMTGCDQLGDVTTGGDCDDGDSTVFPGAEDLPGDGVDQDCLGGDEVEGEPTPGPGDDGDGTGCANCSVPGESSGVGGLALVLAAVLVLRRRPGRGRR